MTEKYCTVTLTVEKMTTLRTVAALEMMTAASEGRADIAERWQATAAALSHAIDHPHVASVYQPQGADLAPDGEPVVVMPFVHLGARK